MKTSQFVNQLRGFADDVDAILNGATTDTEFTSRMTALLTQHAMEDLVGELTRA